MNQEIQLPPQPGSWLKGQLTLPNITAAVVLCVTLIGWQKQIEFTNERQNERIKALEDRNEKDDATYARRDLSDQSLETIKRQLAELNAKVDGITRAVR